MKRGVVASPALITRLAEGFRIDRSINEQELAFYVLYWDEVIVPNDNLVSIQVPLQEDYINSGAISRPKIIYKGSYSGDMVTNAVLGVTSIVAKDKSTSVDEDWVLHQFGVEHTIPLDIESEKESLRLLLSNSLPTPGPDVPLAEILEFKRRFASSRAALHECLDEVYQDVLSSPDAQLQARKSIARLREEIRGFEVDEVKKSGWSRFNLSVDFKMTSENISKLVMGIGLDLVSGNSVPVAALAAAAASFVEIGAGTSRSVGASATDRLGYLTEARKMGVVPPG
ncbi:UNVERIFIED_CONTAM: DUF6236 family protein [Comamonas sp. A-3]